MARKREQRSEEMRLAIIIMSNLFSGLLIVSAAFLFAGRMQLGLGLLALGILFSVWLIILWIVECD